MAVKPQMRVTRLADAPAYTAPAHHGVATFRLQGREAGPTEHFWVGLTYYLPGGGTEEVPAGQETVYVVLDGELTLHADGQEVTLGPQDSVHLTPGTLRRLENRSARPATLLVVIAEPPSVPGL
ncbi:cupin domain-containing protein [Streptomyces sp. NPDC059373]